MKEKKVKKTTQNYGGTEGTQKIFFLLRAHARSYCVLTSVGIACARSRYCVRTQ